MDYPTIQETIPADKVAVQRKDGYLTVTVMDRYGERHRLKLLMQDASLQVENQGITFVSSHENMLK
jgi:hypothetical protein